MLNSIQHHAAQFPLSAALKSISIENEELVLNYDELNNQIAQLSTQLSSFTANQPIAINIDNHPAWVVIDLAALACEAPLVPLPSFFSDTQLLHAMQNAGVAAIITDNPNRFRQILGDLITGQFTFNVANKILTQFLLAIPTVELPNGTVKIT
ncbi:MAG: AMP-binding protein, partial [Pseudomonadota bacterium]